MTLIPRMYLIFIILVSPSVSTCHSEPYFTQFSPGLVYPSGVFLFNNSIFLPHVMYFVEFLSFSHDVVDKQ